MTKVKVWTYPANMGDGSAVCCFFATEKQANDYRDKSEQWGDGWAEDCVAVQELEFNDDGVLMNPDKYDD